MEAVAAQAEAFAPFGGERVGRGGVREGGVERGVEAGHGRDARQRLGDLGEGVQGGGLMEGCQVGWFVQAVGDRVVDSDGVV